MTATTVDPDTDLDTIEHLDWTPGCQTPGGRCLSGYTQPATWGVVLKCGCVVPACDPCAKEMRREKARGYIFKTVARCKTCGAQFPGPINIEDLYIDIRPL